MKPPYAMRPPTVLALPGFCLLLALATGAKPGPVEFDYAEYAATLEARVDDRARVDYAGLKAHPERLKAFTRALADLRPETYDRWSDEAKIAFWINAYNALTLEVIVDHYPIDSSGWFGVSLYPSDSIRQIDGVWDEIAFPVLGRDMTLGHIEHEILRKRFDEPRIHMALVCAAKGCPPLRREPYRGDALDGQLDDQARRYMRDERAGLRIDREHDRVFVSKIFKWFPEDFVGKYAPDDGFPGHSTKERAVLNFVHKHAPESAGNYLENERYSLRYLDYDWSLNARD